jgi:cytochrome oxidase Cu insertion factor (SCO1/SenC/PrrC family)
MRERRGSRAVVAVTMVLALAGALGAPALRASGTTTDPVPLPAVALTDLEGRALGAAQLRGKTVLLNFWAT